MKTTLITEKNADMFLKVVPDEVKEISDLYLGVIDEETDTACGVLAAMLDVDDNLLLTFIYVDPGFRLRGAGKELIETLKEFAEAINAMEVSCIHEKKVSGDGVYELLESCGFAVFEPATTSTYEARLADISVPSLKITSNIVPLKQISDRQWLKYQNKIGVLEEQDDTGNVLSLAKREFYDPNHSFAYVGGEDKVLGELLVDVDGDDINVDELRVLEGDSAVVTLDLIVNAVKTAKKDFQEDTLVVVNPLSEEHMELMNKLSKNRAKKRADTVVQIFSI